MSNLCSTNLYDPKSRCSGQCPVCAALEEGFGQVAHLHFNHLATNDPALLVSTGQTVKLTHFPDSVGLVKLFNPDSIDLSGLLKVSKRNFC